MNNIKKHTPISVKYNLKMYFIKIEIIDNSFSFYNHVCSFLYKILLEYNIMILLLV